jgi:hypothetical protein
MANSTSPVPQVVEGTAAVAKLNQLIDAMSQGLIGGRNWGTSALLVWGYLGGRVAGIDVANGTLTLGASTTSYIVMKKSDGVVSFSTGTTNWNDSSTYWRLYSVVTGATAVTSYTDERFSAFGVFPVNVSAASVAGADKQIQFNDAGSFGAEAGFEYDKTTNTQTVVNVTYTGLALTAASATGGAGFRLPHGAAPTSPTNGDVWTTTAGMYARINGATVGPFAPAGGSVAWGSITGTLSSQTDLQAALDLKQNRSPTVQSVASSATVTPTFSNDAVKITAQAAGLTLANPTGTAIDMAGMVIRIKDNGTARSIAYGTQYRAIGVTLPTTTVISKTLYLAMVYNTEDTKWDVVAVAQEA